MFCGNCGREMQEGLSVCPECGFQREEEPVFVEAESKEFHFVGVRGKVSGDGLREIHTDVKMEAKGEVVVSWPNKIVSSEKTFHKQEVAGIDLPLLPVWGALN